ncbi:uncharacterized protein KRP23_2865 [Phytophthora ramorum]|uniref:uncharacterized protein n=1 Tax=Phytophthora ramorum TaxID=164328 RepID=UPI0030B29F43|nr:hypothetical protein KRP23_2865 [Phytophthora ramorum]
MVECPVHSTYLGEGFPGTPLDATKPIQGPYGTDDDVEFARNLNLKKLNAFALGHGWYFWNFKTELGSRWNFLELEDRGEFLCAAKRGVHPDDLKRGIGFACGGDHVDCSEMDTKFLTLEERADWVFNEYWHSHRHSGATCDFGGAAHLLSTSQQPTPSLDEQHLHLATSPSSPAMVVLWSFVGVAAGILFVVVAGVRIMARHKRRQEYSPLMQVTQVV